MVMRTIIPILFIFFCFSALSSIFLIFIRFTTHMINTITQSKIWDIFTILIIVDIGDAEGIISGGGITQ